MADSRIPKHENMNQLLDKDLNLQLSCRFCLNGDPSALTSIFKPMELLHQNQAIDLEYMIVTCFVVACDGDDELPKWICKECTGQLTISYTFREKCLKTIEYLNDLLFKRQPVIQPDSAPYITADVLRPSNDCETKFKFVCKQPDSSWPLEGSKKELHASKNGNANDSKSNAAKEISAGRGHFHRIGNGPFKCDICGSTLKSRRTLVYHMRTIHELNSTDKSDVSVRRSDGIEPPKPPATQGDNETLFPFKCDICGSGLKSMESTKEHMQKFHIDNTHLKRSVSADNPLECAICRNGYPNRKSLSRHRIRVHGIFRSHQPRRSVELKTETKVKRWQICPICGVMRKDMKCHIATHESDRLFKCEICGCDLKTAVNLKRHLRRVHTEDRQYPCDLCNVAFKAPFQLKRHNRKHTQKRNYGCTYCEKRFIDKATLERHCVVHFGERNVECSYCGKRFQSNLGLQNHVGIHTLERKFKCGLCSLAFITSSAASVHRRTHRNGTDNHFHCGDCSMKFQEVIMLKMHLRAASHTFHVEKN